MDHKEKKEAQNTLPCRKIGTLNEHHCHRSGTTDSRLRHSYRNTANRHDDSCRSQSRVILASGIRPPDVRITETYCATSAAAQTSPSSGAQRTSGLYYLPTEWCQKENTVTFAGVGN